MDGKFNGVKDDEPGIGDYVNGDTDGTGEFAGGEVRFELQIVAFWD